MYRLEKVGIIVCLLLWTAAVSAQSLMASFAVRGGGNMYLTDNNPTSYMGCQTLFDFGYHIYAPFNILEIGLKTGISLGYATSKFSNDYYSQFTNTAYDGKQFNYTITAKDIVLSSQQVIMEVPVMFALRNNHYFLNIGAKFMMPLYNTYTQTMGDNTIDAVYTAQPEVHMINALITGAITEKTIHGKNYLPQYNVLFGLETGYEWNIEDLHRIGLGIYVDVAPWCFPKPKSNTATIVVDPITCDPTTQEAIPAAVTVRPLALAESLMMVDFGIKIYYGINYLNKPVLGLHW